VVATLDTIEQRVAEAGVSSPAVIVVGDVVALHHQLAWFEGAGHDWVTERRPLHGRRVLVPRTRQQASELSARLRGLGAEPVEAPTIAIEPTREPDVLRKRVAEIADGAFDWVALTSVNGVMALWEQVTALGADARLLARTRVAAVGSGTAGALRRHGIVADLVPDRFTTRGLAGALVAVGAPQRVLLPRADIATPTLADLLRQADWDVVEVEAYRTVRVTALDPDVHRDLREGGIDVVAFASSSTVRNLVDLLDGPLHGAVRIAAIGPVTADTCRELGLRVDAGADPHDLDGLVAAVG